MRGRAIAILMAGLLGQGAAAAAQPTAGYLTPPQVIVDILEAEPLPAVTVSPARDTLALLTRRSMPPIDELAAPMLRLAGLRINPATNGPHRVQTGTGLILKAIEGGGERRVDVPPGARLLLLDFSPDGRRLAFTNTTETGIELWIADVASGTARKVDGRLNTLAPSACDWLDDGTALLCRFIPDGRGPEPPAARVPAGPNVQENHGTPGPVRTYQDLLTSAHDEALFEHYVGSQLAFVDAASGRRTAVGPAGLYSHSRPSPDGAYVLVERVKRPFSRLVPWRDFPAEVEVWDRVGAKVRTIADVPMADTVPITGVITGPRAYRWSPLDPATLVWVEALDEGDLRNRVPYRDRVMALGAPFAGEPREVAKTEYRFGAVSWTDGGAILLTENDRATRTTRTWVLDRSWSAPRRLWDRKQQDAYGNPGSPVVRAGRGTILQHGDTIYLIGQGASPEGDRPFLDRLSLTTFAAERLFRSDTASYESPIALLTEDGSRVLTRHETRTSPPNYYVRTLPAGDRQAVTAFADPHPQITAAERMMVTYQRKDGVQLSGTIYLPPGYTKGERLPMLLWAYPREFVDADAASQITGSPHRFTTVTGASHLLLLTQGYAIFDGPTMPIVGPGETANDTYVEQLVASAEAAVDKAVELGIADRHRIGVGGHSYGAFMTANLLAHSDIFRAGIARSGAYNRTLTPFGFQAETRTFWEVPQIYARMSPFFHADKIDEPVLLIHGEADDNSGTFPIQSERLFMALKGHGATARYVTLPHESHGYVARESVLHTVAETLNWLDRFVKDAAPVRTETAATR